MKQRLFSALQKFKLLLFNRESFQRAVQIGGYISFFFIAGLMTIINAFTPDIGWGNGIDSLLTYLTLAIACISLICLFFSSLGKTASSVVSYIFSGSVVIMFTAFLISGKPEGFSALWICLTPVVTMLFYGRKKGTILTFIVFVILILILWVKIYQYIPFLDEIQYKGYTKTFMIRFPILYVSFFFIFFFLETIQDYQYENLSKINEINKRYSTHDQLTGIYNRKGFYDRLEKEWKIRNHKQIGFIIADIDFFKSLNDKYGHLAGDDVLIQVAKIIETYLPNTLYCRWGGEEFLMCYFDDGVTKKDVEEFRKAVEGHCFVYKNLRMHTTISLGVFETNDKNYENKDEWLRKADQALYNAKETGRNKVVYY